MTVDTEPSTQTAVRRITVKLTPAAYESVREMADGLDMSITAVVRDALAVFRFFVVEHRDAKVLLKEGDHTREVVLFHGR